MRELWDILVEKNTQRGNQILQQNLNISNINLLKPETSFMYQQR